MIIKVKLKKLNHNYFLFYKKKNVKVEISNINIKFKIMKLFFSNFCILNFHGIPLIINVKIIS